MIPFICRCGLLVERIDAASGFDEVTDGGPELREASRRR
jgi:hypothetical protein